jgi:ABC-type molybdate transport system permease subunit
VSPFSDWLASLLSIGAGSFCWLRLTRAPMRCLRCLASGWPLAQALFSSSKQFQSIVSRWSCLPLVAALH